jgi:hypothetical protein
MEYKIVGRESITVPAGTFDCFKVQGHGEAGPLTYTKGEVRHTIWYEPERLRRFVREVLTRRPRPGALSAGNSQRLDLVAFKQT